MKAIGLMKSIDEKKISLLIQNFEEKPSKFSIVAKSNFMKSKKRVIFTEEREPISPPTSK